MNALKSLSLCPVKLTTEAIQEIKLILESKKIPVEYGLRIGTNGGGCAGISYFIGFDKEMENDDSFIIEEIPVYIKRKHSMFLWGVEVGFINSGKERGFVFNS